MEKGFLDDLRCPQTEEGEKIVTNVVRVERGGYATDKAHKYCVIADHIPHFYASKMNALASGRRICKRIEQKHPYRPNSSQNASLSVEGLGKPYDGMFVCINQQFVEYRNVR